MSSPTVPPDAAAHICLGDHVAGPVRLPLGDTAPFISQFNQLYSRCGMSIRPVDGAGQVPPQSKPAGGDQHARP